MPVFMGKVRREMSGNNGLLELGRIKKPNYSSGTFQVALFLLLYVLTNWVKNLRSPGVILVNWTPTPRLALLSPVCRAVDHTTLPETLIVWRSGGLIIIKKLLSKGGTALQEINAPEGLRLWISPSMDVCMVKTVTGHLISIRGCSRLSDPRVICKSSPQRDAY
jgi:hypothetical protein